MFFFKNLIEKSRRYFPGRVTLGRFGMWLVKVGEKLQRKYAGWNRQFRMKVATFPAHGAEFHTSCRLTGDCVLTFGCLGSQKDKQTVYVTEILSLHGVTKVFLQTYKITVFWGEVFTPEEMIPKIETILLKHLPNAA